MKNYSTKRKCLILLALTFMLLVVCVLSLLSGSVKIEYTEFLRLFTKEPLSKSGYILRYIRIPRIAGGIAAGMGLAVSGAVIQTILANPLAGPNIIGVNSGAGFLVVLCGVCFPGNYAIYPFAAFLGAFITMTVIYFIGKKTSFSKISLILTGVALNSLLNSATDFIYTINDDFIISSSLFKIGGLGSINTKVLVFASIVIVVSTLVVFFLHNELEVLSLGEETAHSLGLAVGFYRFLFLALAAALAGASISFAGLLGFVGLIIPHIARLLIGSECKYLILTSALLGALLLLFCDYLARMVFRPYEIPVGILLSFLGAPFFIWLLFRRKQRRRNDTI